MALYKGFFGAGPLVLVGVAGMVFGPRLLRMAGRATRPVAKGALRTGVDVYDRTRQGLGRTREGLGDLVDESREELKSRGPRQRARTSSRPKRLADELGAKP